MAKKIIINIGSLVNELHVSSDNDCVKTREIVTKCLLQAVNDSQFADDIEVALNNDGRSPVYGFNESRSIGYTFPITTPINEGEELPPEKAARVKPFINLMNWATLHGNTYLYDRATEAMLNELFKNPNQN